MTGGEGGLATFRDPEAAERFSYLRAYGFKTDYNCRHIGLNGKLSELNAALAWLSLDLLGEAVIRRQAQVQRYRQALESCGDLVWQKVLPGCVHGYKDLAVKFPTAHHRAWRRVGTRRGRCHDEALLLPGPPDGGLPRARTPPATGDRRPVRPLAVYSDLF